MAIFSKPSINLEFGKREIAIAIGSIVGLKLIHLTAKNLIDRWTFREIPGLSNYPIVGSKLELSKFPADKTYQNLLELSKRFSDEPAWKLWEGLEPVIFIHSGEAAESILKSSTYINKPHGDVKELLGDGIFVSSGSKWQTRRKLISPAFQVDVIKTFENSFDKHAEDLIELIAQKQSAEFDFVDPLLRKLFACLFETQMSFQGNLISDKLRDEYFHGLRSLLANHCQKGQSFWAKVPLVGGLTSVMKTDKRIKGFVAEIAEQIIEKKIAQRKESKADPNRFLNILVDELQRPNSALSKHDAIEEINIVLFASSDTSTSTLTWIIFLLATHQNVQDQLRKELRAKFKPGAKFSHDDMNSVTYLDCVVKEAMRLYSALPLVSRCHHKIKLNLDHGQMFTIPANTKVSILISGIHLNPKIWGKDADVFDPDRFNDPRRDARTKNSFNYIPFSAGSRNCVGQRLGNYLVKYFVAKLIYNLRFTTSMTRETVEPTIVATLCARNGLLVKADRIPL